MPRANPLIPSVNAGEFSPRMAARTDFAKYRAAARVLENFLPLAQGGAVRRPGLRFVAEVKDSAKATRLLGFEFSVVQAYALECGEGYLRVFAEGGAVHVEATDAAIANGDFTADIAGWTDLSTGTAGIGHDAANGRLRLDGASASVAWAEQAVSTTAAGQAHVLRFRIAGAPADAVLLRIGTSSGGAEITDDFEARPGWHAVAFTPSASPFHVQFRNPKAKAVAVDEVSLLSGATVEVGTPYAEGELARLRTTQSADTLYLVHDAHPPMKLLRFGHLSWSLVEIDFRDGPYLLENPDSDRTLQPSAASGTDITITAAGHAPFAASDVGRLVRIKHGSTWGAARITGVTSAAQVSADVQVAFGGTGASAAWRLGAWSATTGYPGVATFYRQRLYFAGSKSEPDRLWGSKIAEFEEFTPGTEDDAPVDFTISSDQVNAIRWLAPGRRLVAGTLGEEYVIQASALDEPITPTSIQVVAQSTAGSAEAAPVRIDAAVLFVQRHGRKLLGFDFLVDAEGRATTDLTILADHVLAGGIAELAWQKEPDSVVHCVRGDGQIAALTFKPQEEVTGWCRLVTDGGFESVASIPGEQQDEIWCVVRRTVGGQTRRFVERFAPVDFDDPAGAFFVDSGLSYDGAPATVFAGLDHLEGETVQALADGAAAGRFTVSGGQIALPEPASKVHVGLGYASTYSPLKIEAGARTGSVQGAVQRFHGVTLILDRSGPLKAGPAPDRLVAIPFRTVADPMDAPVPLFTGERYVSFPGDYAEDPRIFVVQDQPLPCTLLGLVPHLKTYER